MAFTNETKVNTRRLGRSQSVSEEHILTFDKPTTIENSGHYKLISADSDCSIYLFDNIFSKPYCQQLFSSIDALPSLIQHETIHRNLIPRLSAWYGPVDYAYSGVVMCSNNIADVPLISAAYKHIASNFLAPKGIASNSDCFLINKYRNGRDSCGEHADNEPEVDQDSPIITLSLGETRYMQIREGAKGNAISVKLTPGSVLVMNGTNFQKKFTHQIPKDNSCSKSRISVTYRTCNTEIVEQRNALSTPITLLSIPQSVSSIPPNTPTHSVVKPRRSSISSIADSPHLSHLSPSSSVRSAESTKSRNAKADNDSLPLSVEAMVEAIDLLKESSLKQELTRHGITIPVSLPEKRKKLKKAVRDSHKKFICKSLTLAPPEPECVTSAITVLEQSIIDLQAEIKAQSVILDALFECNKEPKSSSKSSSSTGPPTDHNKLSARIENIEDILDKIKVDQEEVSNTIKECKKDIGKTKSLSSESCTRLRNMHTPGTPNPPQSGSNRIQSRTSRFVPSQSQASDYMHNRNKPPDIRHRKSQNILVIHDSQLNDLDTEKFSSGFSIQKYKGGSYNDFLHKHMRTVISKPQIDCYVLELGVNDYRYDTLPATLRKAVEDAKKSVEKLLECSSAKILVSLPTPTPGPHEDRTLEFNKSMTEFITSKRGLSDYYRRLFTVNNFSNFTKAIEASTQSDSNPNPLDVDNLHVSEYGLKKLCLNIKLGLYRAFGRKPPRKQTPIE